MTFRAFSKYLILSCCITSLVACEPAPTQTTETVTKNDRAWPSLTQALDCLAPSGPIISAHRGRDKLARLADNSLGGLMELRERGFIMAEIDIGRLKDGTHILFHDGVWDEDSTGRGPIASTSYQQSQSYLLKTDRGQTTSERPIALQQALDFADGKFYLEIDFKSSADETQIIDTIKRAGMIEHVALISYNRPQALRLHKLAPDALIAISVSKIGDIKAYQVAGLPKDKILAWLGTGDHNDKLAQALSATDVPSVYGMMSPRYAKTQTYNAQIVVTDYPSEAMERAGLIKKDAARLADCVF